MVTQNNQPQDDAQEQPQAEQATEPQPQQPELSQADQRALETGAQVDIGRGRVQDLSDLPPEYLQRYFGDNRAQELQRIEDYRLGAATPPPVQAPEPAVAPEDTMATADPVADAAHVPTPPRPSFAEIEETIAAIDDPTERERNEALLAQQREREARDDVVTLASGERVYGRDFEQLTPEQQGELTQLGIAGFTELSGRRVREAEAERASQQGLLDALWRYRTEDGRYDLVAALEDGVSPEYLQRVGFSSDVVQRAQQARETPSQGIPSDQPSAGLLDEITQRYGTTDPQGRLVVDLTAAASQYSNTQLLEAGFSRDDIRAARIRSSALAQLEPWRNDDGTYDLAAALTQVDPQILEFAGFQPEAVQNAQTQRAVNVLTNLPYLSVSNVEARQALSRISAAVEERDRLQEALRPFEDARARGVPVTGVDLATERGIQRRLEVLNEGIATSQREFADAVDRMDIPAEEARLRQQAGELATQLEDERQRLMRVPLPERAPVPGEDTQYRSTQQQVAAIQSDIDRLRSFQQHGGTFPQLQTQAGQQAFRNTVNTLTGMPPERIAQVAAEAIAMSAFGNAALATVGAGARLTVSGGRLAIQGGRSLVQAASSRAASPNVTRVVTAARTYLQTPQVGGVAVRGGQDTIRSVLREAQRVARNRNAELTNEARQLSAAVQQARQKVRVVPQSLERVNRHNQLVRVQQQNLAEKARLSQELARVPSTQVNDEFRLFLAGRPVANARRQQLLEQYKAANLRVVQGEQALTQSTQQLAADGLLSPAQASAFTTASATAAANANALAFGQVSTAPLPTPVVVTVPAPIEDAPAPGAVEPQTVTAAPTPVDETVQPTVITAAPFAVPDITPTTATPTAVPEPITQPTLDEETPIPSVEPEPDIVTDVEPEIATPTPAPDAQTGTIAQPTTAPAVQPAPSPSSGVLPSTLPTFATQTTPAVIPGTDPMATTSTDPFTDTERLPDAEGGLAVSEPFDGVGIGSGDGGDPGSGGGSEPPSFAPVVLPDSDLPPGRPSRRGGRTIGPRPPRIQRPKAPQRPARQRPLSANPEEVAWKQGVIYRKKNLATGAETYSRTPFKGVPNVKGKGSAKKSYRVLSRGRRSPRFNVDRMGVTKAQLNGGIRFSRTRKGRQGRRR